MGPGATVFGGAGQGRTGSAGLRALSGEQAEQGETWQGGCW